MENIVLALALEGQDADEDTLLSLQDWIQEEHIAGIKQLKPETGEAQPGKMGVDPITVLSVILASKAVIELVKAIHVWIQSTRPKVTIKIQVAENQVVEINAENVPAMNELLEQVLAKVNSLKTEN